MGLIYSTAKNTYDWKPELPDFRDEIYKYPKINPTKLPNNINLCHKFKEYTKDFGFSAATSIAAVLDSYNLKYSYNEYNSHETIRNCIKNFKIIDDNDDNKKTLKYTKLCNFKNQLRQALYEGYPIIFGFTVYESIESKEFQKTKILPNPKRDEKILGGLCAVIVGFDNEKNHWIVRHPLNNDYIYIPYDILSKNNNLTSDFWRIKYD